MTLTLTITAKDGATKQIVLPAPVIAGAVPVLTPASFTVAANPSRQTIIGTLQATNSPTSFSIVSGDPNHYFAVGSHHASIASADIPPPGTYTLGINATNANGTGPTAVFKVSVLNSSGPVAPPTGTLVNDGLTNAPAGTAQYPNLFTSASGGPSFPGLTSTTNAPYAFRPSQTVPGVDFPVGINVNATASGNLVTETGRVNSAPTSGDQVTLYLQMSASWPGSGGAIGSLTIGHNYFLTNVTSLGGNAYSYNLAATSGGTTLTLTGMPSQFIVLKDPSNTTNKPSGVNYPGSQSAPSFDITGSNVTFDHWDFSLNSGCPLEAVNGTNISNFVYQNNYWLGNGRGLGAYINGGNGGSFNGTTWQYNVIDGNGVLIAANTTNSTASGNNVLHFGTVPAGVQVGMMACSGTLTQPGLAALCNLNNGPIVVTALNSPSTGDITLSGNASATINNGDLVLFGYTVHLGGAFIDTIHNYWDIGTTLKQYNWFKNCSQSVFQMQNDGIGTFNKNYTEQFNLWDNNVWAAQVAGAHGENVQMWTGLSGENYNSVTCHNSLCLQTQKYATVDTTHFSFNAGGSPGNFTNYGTVAFTNYTIISVNGVANFAGNVGNVQSGMFAINATKIITQLTITGCYVDGTSIYFGQATNWCQTGPHAGIGGADGPGTTTPTHTISGNINMLNGAGLGLPNGWGT